MKKSHFIFSQLILTMALYCAMSFSNDASAQQLNIKTSDGKTRAIKQGQKMSFKLSLDDEFTKGKLQSFTDSSIVIFMPYEDDVLLRDIKLSEIYSIKKTSTMHKVTQAGGAVFMVGGAAMMFEAPSIAGEDGSDWLVRGAGAGAFVIGLIPYLIKPKEYIQGSNAEYSIQK